MAGRVLLVVDMLNDFIDPEGTLFCGEDARRIIPLVRDKIEEFRASGDPVVYINDAHDTDDREFQKFPAHAVKGDWGGRVIDELAPAQGDIIVEKKKYSAFYGTDLDRVLSELGAKEVHVVGVCTSICVMDAVIGLWHREIPVKVHRDAVADYDPEAHDFCLGRMDTIYGAEVV